MTRPIVYFFLVTVLLAIGPTLSARAQGAQDACWIRDNSADVARRPSALDSASVVLDAGTIKVCYSRPSRHHRTIMGELVPYGAPWRLGANEATAIHVPFPARIAGIDVAPGWYSLYAIPEAKRWRIVVNGEAQRWGIPINSAKDLGSAVVPVGRPDEPVETLTITLRRNSGTAAGMDVEWENTRVRIPVERR